MSLNSSADLSMETISLLREPPAPSFLAFFLVIPPHFLPFNSFSSLLSQSPKWIGPVISLFQKHALKPLVSTLPFLMMKLPSLESLLPWISRYPRTNSPLISFYSTWWNIWTMAMKLTSSTVSKLSWKMIKILSNYTSSNLWLFLAKSSLPK